MSENIHKLLDHMRDKNINNIDDVCTELKRIHGLGDACHIRGGWSSNSLESILMNGWFY